MLMDSGEVSAFPVPGESFVSSCRSLGQVRAARPPRLQSPFWAPIVEVAIIYGIFATMIPALALLETYGANADLSRAWHYFWSTGLLSAFLDNAPTYLAFASVAQGQVGAASIGALTSEQVVPGLGLAPADLLTAISCGAVMMGALTYIGNAPNFAVKCIAESAGMKMPSFAGYMKYSVVVLVPIFALVTLVFFL